MPRNYCVYTSTCNTSTSFKKKKSNTSHIVSVLRGKGVDFFYNNSTNILKFKAPTKKENQ
jgi:hypothetical protein